MIINNSTLLIRFSSTLSILLCHSQLELKSLLLLNLELFRLKDYKETFFEKILWDSKYKWGKSGWNQKKAFVRIEHVITQTIIWFPSRFKSKIINMYFRSFVLNRIFRSHESHRVGSPNFDCSPRTTSLGLIRDIPCPI